MLSTPVPIGDFPGSCPIEASVADDSGNLVLVLHDITEHGSLCYFNDRDARKALAFLRRNDYDSLQLFPSIDYGCDGDGDDDVEFFLTRDEKGVKIGWLYDQSRLSASQVQEWCAMIERYLAHAIVYQESIESRRIAQLIGELHAQIKDANLRIGNLIQMRIRTTA